MSVHNTFLTNTSTSQQTIRLDDENDRTELCVHVWEPSSRDDIKGIVVVFHGFLGHGLYPTVRHVAELLCHHHQYAVVAGDIRGHGHSSGTRGYLPSRDAVLQDAIAITHHAKSLYKDVANNKFFLLGSSMGGTIALSVAKSLSSDPEMCIAGVVLLAPMLQLSVSPPARTLLWVLSYVVPTWNVIPSSSTAEKQYRDPIKRKECEDDQLTIKGSTIRISSASTCVELANGSPDDFCEIFTPLLIMVADEDEIVNNQGSFDLYHKAPAVDKNLRRYPALHGLLCEPAPLVDQIHSDIIEWIQARCHNTQSPRHVADLLMKSNRKTCVQFLDPL